VLSRADRSVFSDAVLSPSIASVPFVTTAVKVRLSSIFRDLGAMSFRQLVAVHTFLLIILLFIFELAQLQRKYGANGLLQRGAGINKLSKTQRQGSTQDGSFGLFVAGRASLELLAPASALAHCLVLGGALLLVMGGALRVVGALLPILGPALLVVLGLALLRGLVPTFFVLNCSTLVLIRCTALLTVLCSTLFFGGLSTFLVIFSLANSLARAQAFFFLPVAALLRVLFLASCTVLCAALVLVLGGTLLFIIGLTLLYCVVMANLFVLCGAMRLMMVLPHNVTVVVLSLTVELIKLALCQGI